MKKLTLFILSIYYCYAITPFSLEGLKELNVKFLNKNEIISKTLEEKIENDVKVKLKAAGINIQTSKYAYFKMGVKIDDFEKTKFVRTFIVVQEDVTLLRKSPFESMAITYQMNDDFEAENLEKDIYESIVEYLLTNFLEQYKEEN